MASKIMIYGGSGGIGSALATLLADQGHRLHLIGRDAERLQQVAEATGASTTIGDVCDPELFTQATADAGEAVSGLVYAVGTINLGSLNSLKEADFLQDFRVNAMGAALAVQAALPALKKSADPASIVLFSSVAANQGFKMHASMGMAKGAVSGLTLSLAADLAPRVRVNAIAPSLVRTRMAQRLLSSEAMEKGIAALHALPRIGEPEEIAGLAAFLLSPASSWMTGQVIGIDGGRSTLRTKA